MAEAPMLPHGVLAALSLGSAPEDEEQEAAKEQPDGLATVKGFVTRTQFYSSKLLFFDLALGCYEEEGVGGVRAGVEAMRQDKGAGSFLAAMYRTGARHSRGTGPVGVLSIADVVRLSREIAVGDLVEVLYFPQEADGGQVSEFPRGTPPMRNNHPDCGCTQGGSDLSSEVWDLKVLEKGAVDVSGGSESSRIPLYAGGKPRAQPSSGSAPSATKLARAPRTDVCKYYLNSKQCPLKQCTLRHVEDEAERRSLLKEFKADRNRKREEMQLSTGRQFGEEAAAVGGGKKAHKKNRARIFVDWVISKVGKERLGQGTGVLDVAGGKGELARLLREQGVPCTTIDPRGEAGRSFEHGSASGGADNEQIVAMFDKALWEEGGEHAETVSGCSMVIAMHPDQATEPAIDFAISRGKPFAVVPCCVFGRKTDNLRMVGAGGGDLVVTYEQWVQYLQSKREDIKTDFLGFRGRDVVLHVTT